MEYLTIVLVALGASALTFFSGFGLGTILTPAFILFFPADFAVAATAIVHFLNNSFKLALVGRSVNFSLAMRFGVPSAVGAFIGAMALSQISGLGLENPLPFLPQTSALNFTIGTLIVVFALFDLIPVLRKMEFAPAWLIPGGVVSGFFGGLSGHQGALRSAFLVKFKLPKQEFIATGVTIACAVDLVRIGTYSATFEYQWLAEQWPLLLSATAAAFVGALVGKRLLRTATVDALQLIVGAMMMTIGVLLALGVV